ncbi:MAG: DUF4301 family protein, partial [Deltaproteobacteria bacterium]|nr:DUF4301 family protein [Deltaproteobacteria bacterium]
MPLSDEDQRQLKNHEIDLPRANRQLEMLRGGQAFIRLVRPCTPGDGLLQIAPEALPQLTKHFDQAVSAGRLTRFVPASGAASRMFKPLYADADTLTACRTKSPSAEAGPQEKALYRFLDCLPDFAFYEDLAKTMADDGQDLAQKIAERYLAPILRSLLEHDGLGYGYLPKGLLAFHKEADGARTPFIEHLAEAALANGCSGVAEVHFTVSPDHQELFEAQFAAWEKTLQANYGCQFDVSFSVQKPATDTLSLAASGQPLRDASGRLVLRPGGHGALIENLNDLLGDIVLLRNIDNVVPDVRKTANLNCTKILTGLLLILQQEQHALIRALEKGVDEPGMRELAMAFLADQLQAPAPPDADRYDLIARLDRPLRVCGMVPNA